MAPTLCLRSPLCQTSMATPASASRRSGTNGARRRSASAARGHPAGQLDQQAHPETGAALLRVWTAQVPRGPGDVEVRPGHVVDEAAQELGGGDRGCLAALGYVDDVGVAALDHLGEVVVQRQPPHRLAALT